MQDKLKKFLEEEQHDFAHKMFNDVVDEIENLTPFDFMGRIRDHDTRLVNKVLEMVEKEIEKIEYCSKCCSPKEYCIEWGTAESALGTKDVETLLNSLKI